MREPMGTNGNLYHEPSNFIPSHCFPCLTYSALLHAQFHLMIVAILSNYRTKPFSGSLVPTGLFSAWVPILPFLNHVVIFLLGRQRQCIPTNEPNILAFTTARTSNHMQNVAYLIFIRTNSPPHIHSSQHIRKCQAFSFCYSIRHT